MLRNCFLYALTAALISCCMSVSADDCVVVDNGTGTVDLPPIGCQYLSPDEVHMIVDGLPPGTEINLAPIHRDFICLESAQMGGCSPLIPPGECEGPGGNLGGNQDCFDSTVEFQVNGTGALAGFNRNIQLPLLTEVHTGPRNPGDPIQTFPTDMVRIQGELFGDPDFCTFRITGGTANGLPSGGSTTLTRLPSGDFTVDSFFDITYQIEFQGCPGSVLDGMAGTTQATIRMEAFGPNGQDLVNCCELPSFNCNLVPPTQCIANGGTIVSQCVGDNNGNGRDDGCEMTACCFEEDGSCIDFPFPACAINGGTPAGPGTFCLGDNNNNGVDDACESDDPQCQVNPDGTGCENACPDATEACQPKCVNYNPGTGEVTVTQCDCQAQDECYVQLATPDPTRGPGGNPCEVVDNGTGTVTLPPAGCSYLSPDEVHMIIDGLPAGTTIEFAPIHTDFICEQGPAGFPGCPPAGVCEEPGGNLGGNNDCFNSNLNMTVQGTGALAGFNRALSVQLFSNAHTGPRNPGDPVQEFDNDMFRLQGELFGDPDFCTFRITGGTDNGLPSPGKTTLTQLPNGNFNVDSFFDIEYQIEFQGCPGSVLEGMAGTTTATIRMSTGGPLCEGTCPAGTECVRNVNTLADGTLDICCDCVPITTTVACCLEGSCVELTEADCTANGGVSQGAGSTCTPDPCVEPENEACCLSDGTCLDVPAADCNSIYGGTPLGAGTNCVDDLCEGAEACCLPDLSCINTSAADCLGQGGTPQGAGSDCATTTCEPSCEPTPDGTACQGDIACSDDDQCLPKCVLYDPVTGLSEIVDCDCQGVDDCRVTKFVTADGTSGRGTGGNPCVVMDEGGGTVTLPPEGCSYLSPDEVHQIIDGLPAGTTIELAPIHTDFICREQLGAGPVFPGGCPPVGVCEETGGTLGGNNDCFNSNLLLQASGTGALAGFNRLLTVPLRSNAHTGPRNPGDPVKTFDTDMFRLQGELFGDPDFDMLVITSGQGFGLPANPGQTTLTQLPSGDFNVDSFFDITYQIEFQGAPGGALDGLSGTTESSIRMSTGGPVCEGNCPPNTVCTENRVVQPDGRIQVCCSCDPIPIDDCEPTPDGTACNSFPCENKGEICKPRCVRMNPNTGAAVISDCDCRQFDDCEISLPKIADPAVGGRSLTRGGSGNPCVVPDNGSGTVTLPPAGCEYLSPDEVHMIIDGLPAGTSIELAPIHKNFICTKGSQTCTFSIPPGDCEAFLPDGRGGDCFESELELSVQGTGALAGFNRILNVGNIDVQVVSDPRTPGDDVQTFATDMLRIQGELFGDPDFCTFRIQGGTDFGLPSPGQTTLTRLPSGDFNVDSFFDITYQIEFQGCPGSALEGMGGTTTGTIRMESGFGAGAPCSGACPTEPGVQCKETRTVDAVTGEIEACCDCCFVCNVADHLPNTFAGCYGDADGDGQTTASDRGIISANFGQTDPVKLCLYDMDGDGFITPADRGVVSANFSPLCTPLPGHQNGQGPDPRFPCP